MANCVWSCNFNQHLAALSYRRTSIKFYIHNAFFRHCDLRHRRLYSFWDFFSKSLETLSAKIHGYGSVIGFLLLTLAPLFVGLYFFKVSNGLLEILSLICFIFAIVFYALFVMADKPNCRGTIIAFEGLWQRLSLLSMYLPIAALCIFQK